VLPEPAAEEMNLTLGSSCPTYQPLSISRDALPLALMWIGSVQSAFIAGLALL
jgi:hypothetical protein